LHEHTIIAATPCLRPALAGRDRRMDQRRVRRCSVRHAQCCFL